MKKQIALSAAVIASSIAALSEQASDGKIINIDSSKVDSEMSKDAVAKISSNEESKKIIGKMPSSFADTIRIDGKSEAIDVEAYLALGARSSNREDSTSWNFNTQLLNSYSNCHNACHGSRSWR